MVVAAAGIACGDADGRIWWRRVRISCMGLFVEVEKGGREPDFARALRKVTR